MKKISSKLNISNFRCNIAYFFLVMGVGISAISGVKIGQKVAESHIESLGYDVDNDNYTSSNNNTNRSYNNLKLNDGNSQEIVISDFNSYYSSSLSIYDEINNTDIMDLDNIEALEEQEEKEIIVDEITDMNAEMKIMFIEASTNDDIDFIYDSNNVDLLLNRGNFELTTGNKTYEDMNEDDFEFFVAVVAAEAKANNKSDVLATASSILNRCESDKWITHVKTAMHYREDENVDPIDQLICPSQYEAYLNGDYKKFMDFNVSSDVLEACRDAWYYGIRNNNYCSFRSSASVDYSSNQIVQGGNRFNDELPKEKVLN